MSLIIERGKELLYAPIRDPSCKNKWKVRSLAFVPQQVWECTTQASMDISDEPRSYTVSSKLPGVELENLWVYIEGRTLSIYAGVTGEKQEDGEYHYAEELLGGFQGEIALPEQVHRKVTKAEFENGVLVLVFPKKSDKPSE
jgi:HSP20 family molecular chaperone IbpA